MCHITSLVAAFKCKDNNFKCWQKDWFKTRMTLNLLSTGRFLGVFGVSIRV